MTQPGILQKFYLGASAQGWAGGGIKTTVQAFPGSKAIIVEEGPLRYADVYWTCPGSEHSFGFTIIWIFDGRVGSWFPAWHMQYGGHYPERVITFLKTALLQAYNAKEFVGGRGPREFQQGNLSYVNLIGDNENRFSGFEGDEEIQENGMPVGSHWYRGGLLIPKT